MNGNITETIRSISLKFQDTNCLTVFENGFYELKLGNVNYRDCFPAINNLPINNARVTLKSSENQIRIEYQLDMLTLELCFMVMNGFLLLKTRISELTVNKIETVSVFHNAKVTGLKKILAHGYYSWDQSFLYDEDKFENAESHAIGIVFTPEDSAFIGYLKHNEMFQTFSYQNKRKYNHSCDTYMYLKGKDLTHINEINFSDMVIFTNPDLDLGQKKWADLVVKENNIKPSMRRISGWCSWYYDYFWFSGDILERHLEKFASLKQKLNLDVFVIDANHFVNLGDWLIPDQKFSKGLKYYADNITQAGYIPGIWVGPWMVAERSLVCKNHKDWLCHDQDGNLIEFMSPLGEDNIWGYRSKFYYCLDTSNPDAFDYLRKVFRTYREWGFRYFKTDFMYWGAMDCFEGGWFYDGLNKHNHIEDASKRPVIKRHTPGKTRIEYFTDVLQMIRDEIGPDSIWLGCGQPIWASIGYVDCMRISRDVGPRWESNNSPKELLNDLPLRNFANHRLYEIDPDCILLRTNETKISETQANSLALCMGVAQGLIITSDYVDECPEHRQELFRFIFGDRSKLEFRPVMLGRENDIIIYSGTRKDNGMGVVFFFNHTSDTFEKSYNLSDLEISGDFALEWPTKRRIPVNGTISLSLEPYQSKLYYVKNGTFDNDWLPSGITG
jgi:alpha-galactosidase